MSNIIGVDLSGWQSDLTNGKLLANAGVKFAILKLTEGMTIKDKSFEAHHNMCSIAKIPVGAYVFSHSTTAEGGKAEASTAILALGSRELTLPLFIDIEGDILSAGKTALMASALAFGETVKAAGLRWGVYASLSRFGSLLDADVLRNAGAVIWCAAYNNTGAGMECDIWQRSDTWRVSGYGGNLDANTLYTESLLREVTTMTKTEAAVQWMIGIAEDAIHGYDQASRWGPDYDCSALLISAWEQAGVPVKTRGATYTGNMRSVFKSCGFVEVTDGSKVRGDVLLNEHNHTALYIGNGQVVQASINELGTITGGQSGDQTGREISVRSYYDYPWDCILRYTGNTDYSVAYGDEDNDEVVHATQWAGTKTSVMCKAVLPELCKGAESEAVRSMQTLLIARHFSCGGDGADGDFGAATLQAIENFQSENGLDADGICGAQTWAKLIGG